MQEIQETITDILREFGETILQNPLRVEAFLRDLHPDQPTAISATMEMLHTGVFEEYDNGASKQYCINRLRALAGLSPKAAELAVEIWKPFVQRLGSQQMGTVQQNHQHTQQRTTSPTVHEVLAQYIAPDH